MPIPVKGVAMTIEEREQMSTTTCEARVETREGRLETRARLLKAIMTEAGAWSREARALLALAEQRGITLNEETLVYSDVRDLQGWQARLRQE